MRQEMRPIRVWVTVETCDESHQLKQFHLTSCIQYGWIETCILNTVCDWHSKDTVTLRKHVTKYKNMQKSVDKFLRKSANQGDKIDWVDLIYQFTLILYVVWVCCDRGRFFVHSSFIEKSFLFNIFHHWKCFVSNVKSVIILFFNKMSIISLNHWSILNAS